MTFHTSQSPATITTTWLIPEHSIIPKKNTGPIKQSLPTYLFLQPLATLMCLLFLWVCLFWAFHINEITLCGLLCLVSFTEQYVFKVHHAIAWVHGSFLLCSWIIVHQMDILGFKKQQLRYYFKSYRYISSYEVGTIIIPHFIRRGNRGSENWSKVLKVAQLLGGRARPWQLVVCIQCLHFQPLSYTLLIAWCT